MSFVGVEAMLVTPTLRHEFSGVPRARTQSLVGRQSRSVAVEVFVGPGDKGLKGVVRAEFSYARADGRSARIRELTNGHKRVFCA